MLINGQDIDLNTLPLPQLKEIDYVLEVFLFKQISGDPYENTFKQDPKQFKKLINTMISFKAEVMGLFKEQYENRYSLINQHVVKFDEYDDYLYAEQWYKYQEKLTSIVERYSNLAYDLGMAALATSLGIAFDFTGSKWILKRAEKVAADITTTTQNRVKVQIEAAMRLNEDRAAFDERLKKVFKNPYRGRFIAQQESLNAYMQGKEDLALDQGLGYKTAHSSQAIDKLCSMVNGETVPVNKPFSNGFQKPLFHYGCRCDISFHRDKNGKN